MYLKKGGGEEWSRCTTYTRLRFWSNYEGWLIKTPSLNRGMKFALFLRHAVQANVCNLLEAEEQNSFAEISFREPKYPQKRGGRGKLMKKLEAKNVGKNLKYMLKFRSYINYLLFRALNPPPLTITNKTRRKPFRGYGLDQKYSMILSRNIHKCRPLNLYFSLL